MLILIDKDDTLTRGRYADITDGTIKEAIKKCQEVGHLVGLNSDSPLCALKDLADDLGMIGPIIAEGGAIVKVHNKRSAMIVIDQALVSKMLELRWFLCELVVSYDGTVIYGDVVNLQARNAILIKNHKGLVVGINALRQASLLFYVWESKENGQIVSGDPAILDKIAGELADNLGDLKNKFKILIDYRYSLGIFHAVDTTKENGLKNLRKIYPDIKITMIGDSISDDCGADIQVAVANASSEYLSCANYICQSNYTEGVVEYLNTLA